jgi:hypothetical protein
MGFFGDLFKKVSKTLKKAHKWAKKTKVLSGVLGVVKGFHPGLAVAHSLASKHGYGRRRIKRVGGRRGTNTLTQIDRRVAYTTFPARIPKLSVQLHKIDNSLGLAGNYR